MLDNKIKGRNRATKRTDQENWYITNEMIYREWLLWKQSSDIQQERQPSAQLCRYIMEIAKGILNKSSFVGYQDDFKADMVQDSLLKCLKNLKNLKEEKKESFFNYLSRCVHCQIYTSLKKYYQQLNIKRELMKGNGI